LESGLVLSFPQTNKAKSMVHAGWAYGYLALIENVQFLYKFSDFFSPEEENDIVWDDPDLNISWETPSPIHSDSDSKYPKLLEVGLESLPPCPSK
jgi:dTDP-4-dehydrorhamnose 3,5-epimerase